MKKNWKILALVLAMLLLCTSCEERRVIDISDGGEMLDKTAPASAPTSGQKPASAEDASEKNAAEEESSGETEAETAPETVGETAAGATSDGNVRLVEMTMKANTKGMCLVPVGTGVVFVVNKIQLGNCTITTDPKNFIGADCTLKVESDAEAEVEFVLMHGEQKAASSSSKIAFNAGENTIQVLIRLEGSASGEYLGKLYINGELIATNTVTA